MRVKCLNTHQPPVGTSLVAGLPTYPCQPSRVGKSAANSTNSLSLWERAGVRVKCLNTHQPPVGTSLVAGLPTYPCQPSRVGKSAANSTNSFSLRERAGVRVKCLNTHQPPAGTSLVACLPTLVTAIPVRGVPAERSGAPSRAAFRTFAAPARGVPATLPERLWSLTSALFRRR